LLVRESDFAERGIRCFRVNKQTADPLDRKITELIALTVSNGRRDDSVKKVVLFVHTVGSNRSFRKLHSSSVFVGFAVWLKSNE
jgi:hypothetical protein